MIVKISGKELSEFITNEITFNYDAVSDTFALTIPFFEHWPISRELFRPLHYQVVQIYDDARNLLLTGNLLNYKFKSTSNANEVTVSGYSRTGILDDCPNIQEEIKNLLIVAPTEAEPAPELSLDLMPSLNKDIEMMTDGITAIQSDNTTGNSTCFTSVSLLDLAKKLCAPFGIEVVVDDIVKAKMDETYEQTTTESQDTIAAYLAKLATMKNVVMRSTKDGKLLFTQIDPFANSVARFAVGDGTVNEISLDANGQNMHSKIYLIGGGTLHEDKDEDKQKTNEETFILNPLVKMARPTIVKQGAETTQVKDASKAALANEMKNITVSIDCKGWKMIDDNIIACGDVITVYAPDVFIRRDTKMIIRSITLKENAKEKTSTLNCVFPETITGETPSLIFNE